MNEIIEQEVLGMQTGDITRIHCPFCLAKHEKSMIIKAFPDKIIYNCYRAKCGKMGRIDQVRLSKHNPKKKFTPKFLKEEKKNVPDFLKRYLLGKYEITSKDIYLNRISYLPESKRLLLPCFGSYGEHWGDSAKVTMWTENKSCPKVVLYRYMDHTPLHYPLTGRCDGGPVVLCEDILSAIKLADFCRPIALLGTQLKENQALEIAKQTKEAILYLDYDAVDKARQIKKKYASLIDFSIMIEKKDPKDTPRHQLAKMFH